MRSYSINTMNTPPNKALAELMEAEMQRVVEVTMAGPSMPWQIQLQRRHAQLASRLKAEGRPRMVGHSAACVCGLCQGGAR